MAMIKGKYVTLYDKVESGKDGFNHPVYTETPVVVSNVLISPVSSDAVVNENQLSGKHEVYELSIPKGDTHEWIDRRIDFFGDSWHSFGFPTELIEENIPSAIPWNKKIKVEKYVKS